MVIDLVHFTPWASLIGGSFIGLATALLLLVNGKIAGISGILGGLFRLPKRDSAWRVLFILGLLSAPLSAVLVQSPPILLIEAQGPYLIVAGLLVGFGTRLGAGCTSGHGVCGLSRFSIRSLVATLCFMGAGMITVFTLKHLVMA